MGHYARRLTCATAAAALFAALAAYASGGDAEYERRLKEIAPGDNEAIFKLAVWCMEGDGALKKKGRDHFESLAVSAGGSLSAKAKYQLAVFSVTQGRTYHDLKRAARLLGEASAAGYEPAGRRLAEMAAAGPEKKKEGLDKGNRHLAQREFDAALRALEGAYKLPAGESGAGDGEMLEMLANVHFEMGAEIRRLDGGDIVTACSTCAGTCYQACTKCQGSGKVKGKKPAELVTGVEGGTYKKEEIVDIECPLCKGSGGEICKKCSGMGVNSDILPEEAAKALRLAAVTIQRLLDKKDSWEAVEKVWERVLELRLRLPAGFKVAGAKPVGTLIPPDESLADRPALLKFWESASSVDRHKFLVTLATEAAHFLRPVFMQKPGARTLKEKSPYDLKAQSVPFKPEVAASFPRVFDDRWISVRGRVASNKKRKDSNDWEDDSFKWLFLAGDGRTPLRCLYWTAKGKAKQTILAKLKMGDDFSYLERFIWAYKYAEIEERISDLRKETEVELFGRFVHNPDFGEQALLEIWHVDAVKETRGKNETFLQAEEPPMPAESAEQKPEIRAGMHFRKGLALLRDPVFSTQKKLKPDQEAEVAAKRSALREEALGEFRTARNLFEAAASEIDKVPGFLEEQIGQVNRAIEELLGF